MGGSSSSTRKITILNDDASGVIQISDSVVQRLRGAVEKNSQPTGTRPVQQIQQKPPPPPVISEGVNNLPPLGQFASHRAIYEEIGQQAVQLNKEKEDEITKLEAHWRNKLNAAEKQNIELEKSMAKQFQAGVSQVETLLPERKCKHVCCDEEKRVIDCYQANRTTSLNCSSEVRNFMACAQQSRLSTLIKS